MKFHFTKTTGQYPVVGDKPAPATPESQDALIDDLQTFKTAQYKQKKLIAPSAAARIARRVAPSSKLLNVRLSGGKSPRYIIRARKRGQVHKIIIDATNGAVMRR